MPKRVSMGRAPGGTARRPAARLTRALALSLLLVVALALPASAHAVGGATPTNFQTRILSVTPRVPGLTIRPVEAGARLELINETGSPVIIPGYDNEPYLRVGPDGVEENTRSPATYLNRTVDASTKPPTDADSKAEPVWHRISGGNRVAWHDHRTHWMGTQPPPQVTQDPGREYVINPEWKLELQRADQAITVTGDLRWVPGPSSVPWLAGAAVLVVVLLLASRTPAWLPVLAGALVAMVVIDVVHTVAVWSGLAGSVPVKLYGSIVPVAGWLVAVIALLRLRAGQRESGIFFAIFAAALALVSALGDLPGLSSSQLVGTFPEWITRLAIAARVGLAAGIAAGGLIAMRKTTMPTGRSPSAGPAAASILLATLLAGGMAAGTLLATPAPASAQSREVILRAQADLLPQRQGSVRVVAVAVFRDGRPAGGVRLRATATGGGRPERFQLRPAGQRGVYAAVVSLRPGTWNIRINATGDASGETTVTITVPERGAPAATAPTTTRPPDTTTGPGGLPGATGKPPTTASTTTALGPDQPAASSGGGLPAGPIAVGLSIAGVLALAAGVLTLKRGRWF